MTDAVLGCIVGGALGDAWGTASEGNAPALPAAPDFAAWRLTDDTQLTLATCEALTDGLPTPERVAAAVLRWYRARRLTGLGAATLKALRDLDAGAHWALAGCRGDRAAGNGAAMRSAPLAFRLDPHDESDRRTIRDICRVTHHHDEAYAGAMAVVLAVRGAADGVWSLATVAAALPDTRVRDGLMTAVGLPPGTAVGEAARRLGTSGFAAESVTFALWAASRSPDLGFTEMLGEVIAAGGDADTNASMAGQMAGAALGLRGLPAELVERLPERETVLRAAGAFAAALDPSRGRSEA